MGEGVSALPFFDLVLDLDGMVDIEKTKETLRTSHEATNNWSEGSSSEAPQADEISGSVKLIAAM